MTAEEMFKYEGWEKNLSDDGKLLSYTKVTDKDFDNEQEILINLEDKTINFEWYLFCESQGLCLNRNEVDAFCKLMEELKEDGEW